MGVRPAKAFFARGPLDSLRPMPKLESTPAMRWIDGLAALAITAAVTFVAAQPALVALEGPAFDTLLTVRHQLFAQQNRFGSSQAVVVGLDRETALRPPFDRLPEELWTPQLARVMTAVLDAGAVVVAQQEAFAASAEDVMAGYDADYLAVLERAGGAGQLVLGRMGPGPDRVSPFPAHVDQVGGYRNVRSAELPLDPDGVVRRARLYEELLPPSGAPRLEPTLALELAARLQGERPQLVNGEDVELGGYRVPGSASTTMLLNPEGGTGSVPVFSLADLFSCAEEGETAYFEKYFRGKVVIFGGLAAASDRHLTSARFLGVSDRDRSARRCNLPALRSLETLPAADGTADAVVTAIAVNNLAQGRAINSLEAPFGLVIAALLALAASLAGLRVRFWLVLPVSLLLMGGWVYLAAMMLARQAWLMPLTQPLLAVTLGILLAWAYRFALPRRARPLSGPQRT